MGSGFGCFPPFCAGFFPSLWICPLVICVVADFSIGSLSGHPECWWWSISVAWFSFYLSSPFAVRLLRSTPDPACLGAPLAAVAQRGMLPVSFSAIFVPGWCLPNVSLLDIEGSGSCLRRQSTFLELNCWAVSSVVHSGRLGCYVWFCCNRAH